MAARIQPMQAFGFTKGVQKINILQQQKTYLLFSSTLS
jgi:hypothetical protein